MSEFLKRFCLFLIPIILMGLVLELYLRNRTSQNEILAKLDLVEKNQDAELIFIGNSHGRNAFIPDEFSQESINLCIGGSTTFYNQQLLHSVINKLPKLKYIVYNISYQTLYYDMGLLPNDKKAYEFYHYLGADSGIKKTTLDYFSILSSIGFRKGVDNFIGDRKQRNYNWIEAKGFKKELEKISTKNIEEAAKNRIDAHHQIMNFRNSNYNKEQLLIAEQLADKYDLELIYVILPVESKYREAMISPFNQYDSLVEKFANDSDRLNFNFADSLTLDYTHFVDPDHLNYKGAKVISKALSQLIKTQ